MQQYTDMTGRVVEIPFPPKRIISVVPSQTELLYDLGLDEEVVGITKFCIHPDEWYRNKKRVGGTKSLHIDIISQLQPDLIIANKEENTREQIEELAALFPVWVSDIQTIDQGLQMITEVGTITGTQEKAREICSNIKAGFASLGHTAAKKRVAYFIWRNPWMCAGGDTFISDVITTMGWENVLAGEARYPVIELYELAALQPDTILLSSEPYPFKDKHIDEIRAVLPNADIQLVDGEMFSWYGSRMQKAAVYLRQFLH